MKRLILFFVLGAFFSSVGISQIKEISTSAAQITIIASGSIYYPDLSQALHDPIHGLVVMYISNEQDGSAARAVVLNGTHYYKPNPDTISFTKNSGTGKIYLFGLEMMRPTTPPPHGPLTGQYSVKINGVTYTVDTSNVVYLLPCHSIIPGIPSSIITPEALTKAILDQNYPNPFNSTTTINFSVESNSHVRLQVYDESGRLVNTLQDNNLTPGSYSISWNGTDRNNIILPSGNYYYQISIDGRTQAKKMIKIK